MIELPALDRRMNNTLFESPLIRILNTFLLAGILATLVLILLQLREPLQILQIRAPISVQGVNPYRGGQTYPVQVEISR
jgi:hypothetical protein